MTGIVERHYRVATSTYGFIPDLVLWLGQDDTPDQQAAYHDTPSRPLFYRVLPWQSATTFLSTT